MASNKKFRYYIISGLILEDNNRGTAALSYGAFPFLKKFYGSKFDGLHACNLRFHIKPWKFGFKKSKNIEIEIDKEATLITEFYIWILDFIIYKYIPLLSCLTRTKRILKKVKYVAAINGGDGFSDIYGTETFESRLFDTNLAIKEKIPLILLPQTLGPFNSTKNYQKALQILTYAQDIFVRDLKFAKILTKRGIDFELARDLSYYMKPQPFDIKIPKNAVGINVSGLCYSNQFRDLSGKFKNYPVLIERIIHHFQKKQLPIYLISHSYNYKHPELTNDDLLACREVYEKLQDKNNVVFVDKELNSPQTKFLISQFEFFIGTRMHSNFAAIFTKTPVFGLAYSYKYEGAFNSIGLKNSYELVTDIQLTDIENILDKLNTEYLRRDVTKKILSEYLGVE